MKIRDARWDNYKAFLALLMVYGHLVRQFYSTSTLVQALFLFIYLFHMPAFLFVGGMFSKKAVEQNDMRRIVSLFLQYLLVKFVLLFANMLLDGEVKYTNLLSESGVAWFALSMMECMLLTMLLKKTNRIYVLVLAVILGCLVGYCPDIGSFLSLSRTIVYFPYFWLGYCLEAEKLGGVADRKAVKICGLMIIVVIFFTVYLNASSLSVFNEFIKAKAGYSTYADVLPNEVMGGLYRLVLYAAGFMLVPACLFLMPKQHIPVVSGIGSRTLAVYAFHYPLVSLSSQGGWLKKLAASICPNGLAVAGFYLLVSTLVLAVTSIPPLEKAARKITGVPQEEDRKRKRNRETGER